VARFLRRPPAAAGDRSSLLRTSEGGRFLLDARAAGDRWPHRVLIEEEVERDGAWAETWEWRPGDRGTDRIERLAEGRYRASCDYYGSASVELAGFDAALEAVCVLGVVQRTLQEAIDWGTWPDDRRRRRPLKPGERYLRVLARESRKAARLLGPVVKRALKSDGSWTGGPPGRHTIRAVTIAGRRGLHVEVAEDSLAFATYAASLDRALAFQGVYAGLQRDLRHVLGWEPLPPEPGV